MFFVRTDFLPQSSNLTDVCFKLPDGSVVSAHKLVLAVASPFFEAQFYGLLATEESPVIVKNVESGSFRKLLIKDVAKRYQF